MSVSRRVHVLYRMVASVSIVALLSSSLPAQTPTARSPQQNTQTGNLQGQPDYATPLSPAAQPYSVLSLWKPYTPHGLPQPVLRNSDRLRIPLVFSSPGNAVIPELAEKLRLVATSPVLVDDRFCAMLMVTRSPTREAL